MQDFISALVLGLVEGVTEFLPVSSTGHLIIFNTWFSFTPEFTRVFDVVIQMGAILAVVVFFWKRVTPRGENKQQAVEIWKKALIGVLPALAVGFLVGDFVEDNLFNSTVVAISLIIGGVLLIIIERKQKAVLEESFNVSYKKAFYIGCIQCVALVPGVSRAAATIIGAMFLGASRKTAAEFSFFLAIPTLAAASLHQLASLEGNISSREVILLLVGFVVSFFTAWAVIRVFMRYIQTKDFAVFGYYRIALGIVVLLFFI